jgi:hypothetical protein
VSEKVTPDNEHLKPAGFNDEPAETIRNSESKKIEGLHYNVSEQIELARKGVEQQAVSSKESAYTEEQSDTQEHSLRYITKKIKGGGYKESLGSIRRQLTPTERNFSNLIHQPTVERVSDIGSKTIARPSGILGGGIVSLVGSLIVLLIAKHIGFKVPASIFAILFITGFLLGLFVEAIIGFIKSSLSNKK